MNENPLMYGVVHGLAKKTGLGTALGKRITLIKKCNIQMNIETLSYLLLLPTVHAQ